MLYRVEVEGDGDWSPLHEGLEADNHHQAVARCCEDEGFYRSQAHGEDLFRYFYVPPWGPPEPFLPE